VFLLVWHLVRARYAGATSLLGMTFSANNFIERSASAWLIIPKFTCSEMTVKWTLHLSTLYAALPPLLAFRGCPPS
jgi:hypothetical protein